MPKGGSGPRRIHVTSRSRKLDIGEVYPDGTVLKWTPRSMRSGNIEADMDDRLIVSSGRCVKYSRSSGKVTGLAEDIPSSEHAEIDPNGGLPFFGLVVSKTMVFSVPFGLRDIARRQIELLSINIG